MALQANADLAAARARIQELEANLAAAEGARDEFVYHLSPKKPPRPAGSPAPKASPDQLRAALKVCLPCLGQSWCGGSVANSMLRG